MNCPNCGSINNGGTFCNNCGKSLIQNNNVNQNMVQGGVNGVNPQVTNYGASTQSINQNINVNSNQVGLQTMISNQQPAEESFEINDNELLNAYIGKNVTTLRDNSFSWCAFFFGTTYMFYRKMWIMGIINAVLRCIPVVSIISAFYFAINFKKEYVKNAISKIEQIKFDNPRTTQKELQYLCSKKGGTAIWAIIVFGVLPVIIVFLLSIVISMNAVLPQMNKARSNAMVTEAETYAKAIVSKYTAEPNYGEAAPECVRIDTLNKYLNKYNSSNEGYILVNDVYDTNGYIIYMTNGEIGIYGSRIGNLSASSVTNVKSINIPSYCE